MHVIHVCQRDDPSTGGAVRVAAQLVDHLLEADVNARLLFLYGGPGFFSRQLNGQCDYLGLKNSRDFTRYSRLHRYIKQQGPDIIHHHDDLLWPQLLTLRHPQYKKVIHAHGGGTGKPQPVKTRLLYASQRYSANGVACITEEARSGQERNVGFSKEISYVVPNCVDTRHYLPPTAEAKRAARRELGLPPDVPVIGYVGRLHNEMKGADDFLRVLAALPATYRAIMAGAGPDEAELKRQAKDLKLIERVRFTGLLNDTLTAYHAMDVFCFTSRHEPFGLTILEAMACRVPVIGFRCSGGSGEILNDSTGAIIENRDIPLMARAVMSVQSEQTKWYLRLNSASEMLSSRHNWRQSTNILFGLYQSLVPQYF
jgi:glycosyltransferase involved in cell wall biosynthesis